MGMESKRNGNLSKGQEFDMECFVLNQSDGSNDVRSSMFEAKNRVFEFDYHKMNMFEFIRCSKK